MGDANVRGSAIASASCTNWAGGCVFLADLHTWTTFSFGFRPLCLMFIDHLLYAGHHAQPFPVQLILLPGILLSVCVWEGDGVIVPISQLGKLKHRKSDHLPGITHSHVRYRPSLLHTASEPEEAHELEEVGRVWKQQMLEETAARQRREASWGGENGVHVTLQCGIEVGPAWPCCVSTFSP